MTSLPGPDSETEGISQPITEPEPPTGINDAGWEVTDTLDILEDWPSGLYIIEFVLTTGSRSGRSRWYPLIVRPQIHDDHDIFVQVMSSTWQAYNHWPGQEQGGKSIYGFNSDGDAANVVSYNRPLRNPLLPHGEDGGPMAVYYWEAPLIRYLEREGYSLVFFVDQDTDCEPEALQQYNIAMTAGHDEYWSMTQRDAFEEARDGALIWPSWDQTQRIGMRIKTMVERWWGTKKPPQRRTRLTTRMRKQTGLATSTPVGQNVNSWA